MIDLDAELLDNQEEEFKPQMPPLPPSEPQVEFHPAEEQSFDQSFKGIDASLLGFRQDGIIENKMQDIDQDDPFMGRQKSRTVYIKGSQDVAARL